MDQVPRDRVVSPVPQRDLHQLAMGAVRRPKRPDRVRQQVEAALAEAAGISYGYLWRLAEPDPCAREAGSGPVTELLG